MMKKRARLLGFLFLAAALLRSPVRAPASALDDLTDAAGQGLPNVPEPPAPTPADDDGYAERRERYRQMQEQEERERQERQQRWEQEARERQERDERERQERDAREQEERDRQNEMRRQQQSRDEARREQDERDSQEREDRFERRRAQEEENDRQNQLRQQADQERRDQEERTRQAELRRQQEERERQERLRQEQLAREREERARQEALRRQQEEEARQARLRAQAAAARTQWAADDARNGSAFDDIFAGAAGSDPDVVDLTTATGRTPALLRGGGSPVSLRTKAPPVPQPEATIDLREDPPEPPPPPPRWQIDWNQKFIDLGFAYASMYLKSKVDGLASIPELSKDALDLHKRLREHTTGYLDKLFTTAGRATDPNADLGALSDRTWANFQTASANFDEDARRGAQNAVATTSSGALPEGSHAAEVGIGQGQAQLQDTQELVKWCEEHRDDRR